MGCLFVATLLSCQKEPKTLTVMSYNVGVFSKYQENSMPGIAQLIRESGAEVEVVFANDPRAILDYKTAF